MLVMRRHTECNVPRRVSVKSLRELDLRVTSDASVESQRKRHNGREMSNHGSWRSVGTPRDSRDRTEEDEWVPKRRSTCEKIAKGLEVDVVIRALEVEDQDEVTRSGGKVDDAGI